jgi:hypothetical protein
MLFQKFLTKSSSLLPKIKNLKKNLEVFDFVGVRRLELPRRETYGPEPYAATNYATRPYSNEKAEFNQPVHLGARGGNRTRTALRPQNFKSCVATNYTTRASAIMIS